MVRKREIFPDNAVQHSALFTTKARRLKERGGPCGYTEDRYRQATRCIAIDRQASKLVRRPLRRFKLDGVLGNQRVPAFSPYHSWQ